MLTTQIENRDGIHLVHVLGALDSMVIEQLKDMMDPLVNHAHVRIVLDCEKLTCVNSKGLALPGRSINGSAANAWRFWESRDSTSDSSRPSTCSAWANW